MAQEKKIVSNKKLLILSSHGMHAKHFFLQKYNRIRKMYSHILAKGVQAENVLHVGEQLAGRVQIQMLFQPTLNKMSSYVVS